MPDNYQPHTRKSAALTALVFFAGLALYGFLGWLLEVRTW